MPRIYTVGHGTRAADELIATIASAGVRVLADVRTFPASRRHPQFAGPALAASLGAAGIDYVHLRGLGGRRRASADSVHGALRVGGFRGYADHLRTPEFAAELAQLTATARDRTTAYMCAETLWWRCHRRILSDRLVVDGWDVVHLVRPGSSTPHTLWDIARVVDGELVYDGAQERLL